MRSDVSREGLNPVDTAGKTRTSVIPAPAVEETRVQTSECQRLSRLVADLIRVSEGLCYARLKGSGTQAPYVAKKTFGTSFDAEIQAEGEVLSGPGLLHELGLEALEGAVRRCALDAAARFVEWHFNADRTDHSGPYLPCTYGQQARYGLGKQLGQLVGHAHRLKLGPCLGV